MSEKKEEDESIEISEQSADTQKKRKPDPIKRITQIVFLIAITIFIWYLFADRYAPFTDQARTKTVTIPLVPKVSGYLSEINVESQSTVKFGDLLFRIEQRPFVLAVKKAKAYLDNVAQQVGALTATVKSAAGRLGVSKAQLDRAQRNYDRTQHVLKKNPGALSQADLDQTETTLAQAVERVASAEADLDKAKQQLGTSGEENAQLREALVTLQQAEYDLEQTSIYAPSNGVIESFNLYNGYYAQAGKPLVTFIPSGTAWIEADFRENSISNINAGDEVEFALDIFPGKVFDGIVKSVGYGVSYGEKTDKGTLPKVSNSQSWLRDPQRFPVIIEITDKEIKKYIRYGGQADVIIYAGKSSILNLIGWFQIRINSLLSYVR
jgi:multidrug resistance efflux pump